MRKVLMVTLAVVVFCAVGISAVLGFSLDSGDAVAPAGGSAVGSPCGPVLAADPDEKAEDEAVGQACAALMAGSDATLGLSVVDLDCGIEVFSSKAHMASPSASVVKLLIALDRLEHAGMPEGSDAEDLRRMLAASDDSVASRLWVEGGGPEIVRRQVGDLGLADTRPPGNPGRWGDTQISAADVISIYRQVLDRQDEVGDFLTEALGGISEKAVDGFGQYFGVAGQEARPVLAKQGWGNSGGRRVLNTTGVVRAQHLFAVALLSTWSPEVGWDVATAALTKAVKVLLTAASDRAGGMQSASPIPR